MEIDPALLGWLRIALAVGFAGRLHPERPHPFLDPGKTPAEILETSDLELRREGAGEASLRRLRDPDLARAAAGLGERSLRMGLRCIHRDAPEWPGGLRDLPDAPAVLWVRGDLRLLGDAPESVPLLSVVGTRYPSPYGTEAVRAFLEVFGMAGLGVVSGLARGIDGLAHRIAIETGATTLAVLGNGLDRIYPPENRALAERILARGGLLLSEYPPGYRAHPGTFPRRNRILVALGRGLFVVEAGRRSGSLHSAAWALAYDRPIWALPGPWKAPTSEGCHQLLRDGARLADTPDGLLRDLGLAFDLGRGTGDLRVDDPVEAAVLQALTGSPQPPEALATRLGRSLAETLCAVGRLAARGFVTDEGGCYRRLAVPPPGEKPVNEPSRPGNSMSSPRRNSGGGPSGRKRAAEAGSPGTEP